MANTYSQLYIQFIFAVQNRECLINPQWEERLYQYISGIVRNHKHKMIVINGVADHIHILISMHPEQSISKLMQTVKGESSTWINEQKLTKGKFNWQEGYGAFSYSKSHQDNVYKYIMNQKEHHKKRTFIDEYKELLDKFEIEYDEKYVFKAVV